MRALLILIATVNMFVAGDAYSQTAHRFDWDADLDYLAAELPAKHYNLFAVKTQADWLAGIERIRAAKDSLTDYGIALRIQQLIAGFGDSHTGLDFQKLDDRARMLPLKLYWFDDGIYILSTTEKNSGILGHRVVEVNGMLIGIIADSLSTLVTVDNQAVVKKTVPKMMTSIQILNAFGFAGEGPTQLGIEDVNGKYMTYAIEPAGVDGGKRRAVRPDSLALFTRNERAFFVDYYQPADRLYYLQYNKCWGRELEMEYGDRKKAAGMPSFEEFGKKVFRTLEREQVDKLVLDLRFNSGGASSQGRRLAEKLAEYMRGNPGLKVYVILGRETFSSAVLNALDFKRLLDAVFVGEQTYGKPNSFGEVRGFTLPSSGLWVGYSTKYFERATENVNTLEPDVKTGYRYSDFIRGVDPAYEWIADQ